MMDAGPPILIVDDSERFCASIRLVLEDEGYAVYTACSGPTALAMLGVIPRPSLVLLDLVMPGMDGLAVAQAIRARRDLSTIPVVLVSSFNPVQTDGLRVLPKPIDLETLLAVAREHRAPGLS